MCLFKNQVLDTNQHEPLGLPLLGVPYNGRSFDIHNAEVYELKGDRYFNPKRQLVELHSKCHPCFAVWRMQLRYGESGRDLYNPLFDRLQIPISFMPVLTGPPPSLDSSILSCCSSLDERTASERRKQTGRDLCALSFGVSVLGGDGFAAASAGPAHAPLLARQLQQRGKATARQRNNINNIAEKIVKEFLKSRTGPALTIRLFYFTEKLHDIRKEKDSCKNEVRAIDEKGLNLLIDATKPRSMMTVISGDRNVERAGRDNAMICLLLTLPQRNEAMDSS
ncbi:unnamed protein product [Vitrella brassicaformis CCMP3155]|uniref:Uncharacterized protein n=1 Tax=Vitrella brassicaformis (strain CCMP3155) TaxID=1169540 RepID=A0A0G4EL84_VITBC|nr:unnamed protein product [Vitrella brassicaformis CCMP3155]|eukprot:CEL98171.1 unnamed protein product [Vitrella brassicaformis CCMP3155]